jgi:hypothetical protein
MKNFLFLAILPLFGIIAISQDRETRNLSHFDGISVSSAVEVILKHGTEEKAEVVVSGTDADNVITEVTGSDLKIHMRSGNYHHVDATVFLTYKELKEIEISSAAKVQADEPIQANEMNIDVSSAGKGNVNLNVGKLNVDISSAGNLDAKGKASKQNVEVSSAGGYDGEELLCDETEVDVSSAGHARVCAAKSLNAEANSGGSIKYSGNPEKEYTSENSGGNVRKVD